MSRIPTILVWLAFSAGASIQSQAQTNEALVAEIQGFLKARCRDCHSGPEADGGLDLSAFERPQDAAALIRLRRMGERVRIGEMPPADAAMPDPAERESFVTAVRSLFASVSADAEVDPGRVTMRRLSRYEYDRTVRDLLGIGTELSRVFPADDLGYGFDNVGDALSFSILHLEKYLAAARDLASRAIITEDPDRPTQRRFEAEAMKCELDGATGDGEVARLYSNGEVVQDLELPREGEYRIVIRGYGNQAGRDPVRIALFVDDLRIEQFDLPETREAPGERTRTLRLDGGRHRLAVAFVNDYYAPDDPDPKQRDRNCYLDRVDVIGPVDARPRPFAHHWIFGKDRRSGTVAKRAAPLLDNMLLRTWRRPPRRDEIRRMTGLIEAAVDEGSSFESGVQRALIAALASPNFLFRAEPGAVAAAAASTGRSRPIDPFALASRLSYFIWSSGPDEGLLEAARDRSLLDPQTRTAAARRLLADDRSDALAESFALQWLETRNLLDLRPDPQRFPDFDEDLRTAMLDESRLYFLAILREKRPIRDLLESDWTFLNERLARHYGVVGVKGPEMRKVLMPPQGRRGGILAQAAMQTVTSNPSRTSPVKRGKWILENVLDAAPAPPPPGADGLIAGEDLGAPATLRERLSRHRAAPECATCHLRMDALGFALEHFDAIGSYRESDGGQAIDATGDLPGGRRVDGLAQLEEVLAADGSLPRALARKLFIYAVGRNPDDGDRVAIDRALAGLPGLDATLEDLILAIVGLEAFSNRSITR